MPRHRLITLPGETFRGVVRSRDVIHARWADSVSVAQLAREAGLSEFYFIRSFERAFGVTPHRYQVRLRLANAKRLLQSSARSVTEICFETGFSSLGSWSSLFAREFGRSPTAYRREMVRLYQVPRPFQRVLVPMCFLRHFADPAVFEKRATSA
jgi:transcriptional regulator GlxA family with amidase domain